jgi:hypothetical protein
MPSQQRASAQLRLSDRVGDMVKRKSKKDEYQAAERWWLKLPGEPRVRVWNLMKVGSGFLKIRAMLIRSCVKHSIIWNPLVKATKGIHKSTSLPCS